MKRNVLTLLGAALLLAAIGWSISSQVEELEPPTGYIRSDLQLISQESKDSWSPAWTGPIEAATILAWFNEHGYARFLRDLNGDGEIDELDTIELANILGRGVMRTDSLIGTTDARLVIGLAQYVADLYPDEFVLKIYDAGFPEEFAAAGSAQFAPDAIPGIELRLEGEPTLAAYEYELETSEGVIVGLVESEERNTYFSGRSYLFEETSDGYTPVDLAWAEEDRFEPGHQGRVLETVAMTDDRLYLDYRMGWTPVEFMLALSPVDTPEFSSMAYICPEDALAYHVTVTPTPFGSIRIEECVTREGGFDTYEWIVTNIDFLWMGCGLCYFGVSNSGFTSVAHSGPPLWPFTELPWAWSWQAPLGSCGIQKGQSAVFSITVPGPTVDMWVPAAVKACPPPPPAPGTLIFNGDRPPFIPVRTTGPGELDLDNCPDLTVEILDMSCVLSPASGLWVISVDVRVHNIETLPVTAPFAVLLESDMHPAVTSWGPAVPIPGSGGFVDGVMEYTISSPTPPCPETFTVTVDAGGEITECLEDNNVAFGDVCCKGEPDDELGACCYRDGSCSDTSESDCTSTGGIFEGVGTSCATTECPGDDTCPDLIVEILANKTYCETTGVVGAVGWKITLTALVTNIGDADATCSHIRVYMRSDSGGLRVDTVGPLGIGDSEEAVATWTFDPKNPPNCPEGLEVEVDVSPKCVDECDEGNNEDSTSLCCR